MTNEEAIMILENLRPKDADSGFSAYEIGYALNMAIKALEQEPCDKYIKEIDHLRKYICKLETQIVEQEPCRDMKEIREVISCDADAETKLKMISNILTTKPHYFEEPQPCEDAISRKYIQENYAICADMLHPDADIVMAWVDEAPPVRVEKKTGQWIPYCYQNCKCSVCGYVISEYDTEGFNFCPNCGDRKK